MGINASTLSPEHIPSLIAPQGAAASIISPSATDTINNSLKSMGDKNTANSPLCIDLAISHSVMLHDCQISDSVLELSCVTLNDCQISDSGFMVGNAS